MEHERQLYEAAKQELQLEREKLHLEAQKVRSLSRAQRGLTGLAGVWRRPAGYSTRGVPTAAREESGWHTAMQKLRIVALGFWVGDGSRGRFATPADFPLQA
jgi:hypothetical protein